LIGVKPKKKVGDYFRNNVWHWRRLAEFVIDLNKDILTLEDAEQFSWNNGYKITKRKAEKIAVRLKEAIKNKSKYKEYLKTSEKFWIEKSREIEKKGKSAWPFSWDNVKEFAEFCENSGGFRIC